MKQTQKLLLFVAAAILLAANAHAGRWITRDPMEVQEHMERDPHAFLDLNPYTFVRNNPLKYFDLNGLNAVAYVDAQGHKWWWGPYDKTPPGYTFQLTPYNQEFLPPGMIWGQDQYGNAIPVPNDIMGLQPSPLGDFLLGGVGPALRGRMFTPCPQRLMGKGIVLDGRVVAHAPIESILSHARLAEQSGTLIEVPAAGVRGSLVPGAQAFTYSANGAYVDWVAGSMNFNSTVNNITVNAVSAFVQGLK